MKIYTKLFIAAVILFILPGGLTQLLALLCFIAGLILLIVQNITEIKNKNKTPNQQHYAEAWKAYEDVSKKKKQDTTPPWEK